MRRRMFLAACLPLFLSACALMALGLEKPEVRVVGLDLQDATLFEQTIRMKLRVTNPNAQDVAIDGMRFAVEINGQEFAKGMTGESVVLPRLGDAIVTVDARTSLIELLRQLPKLKDSNGKFAYRVYGDIVTRDYGRLPFDRKGELSAEEIGNRLLPKDSSTPPERRGSF
ncbi:MAG: LEA type 2 family protein [Betaproteobacteria bacterium]|nr:LEA type 2 family protein [Betaproteobacteria bacterium]